MSRPSDDGPHRVVAHFKGGKLLKGSTSDFDPFSPTFRLVSERPEDNGTVYQVRISDLKAVFFVKTLDGDLMYREKKRFGEVRSTGHLMGIRIEVYFKDGEVVRGTTIDYNGGLQGFFVSPVDPKSNNDYVYVVANAVREIKLAGDVENDLVGVKPSNWASEPSWAG
jgi:hypothetical protein